MTTLSQALGAKQTHDSVTSLLADGKDCPTQGHKPAYHRRQQSWLLSPTDEVRIAGIGQYCRVSKQATNGEAQGLHIWGTKRAVRAKSPPNAVINQKMT
eukprot:6460094-Amphidinium_carterae.2